ncbi:bifunctional oligoribonuclease/PAP phosphatase NrnA [Enterococcus faecalis]|uniref:DHH family phosphoesterase n=1 Tax=Enterococcus TaxID=1350 RepID=UPI0013D095D7|nr:bifunctional oligoribonuclease/PAP phosphatase NrnA [Enterococcus faecalis]EGO2712609.1 bifunctional oligoribonuclease/PAP phosphatase NrnA [Enterococcus faecalis]EGO7800479.1 bifunctional oligoribonuclease/PAP phosphatase NrnA [Enterococcus faecalis]EGO7832807.1 bifunctional oligoribonuclease/PAP phosphatase NrnA [Enterococcus faecalis]EGO8121864.1 bifunctional oligoribonuclease/PAP phosphatase NrnA [Enterococcus faecalis]EGO8492322.1 bifunctional oligoribonuclease/PAP phosphatase NrnA [En
MDVVKEIMAAIKQYETIIIHRHQRPDPDAIGSQVGLAELLRASFPEKNIYQVGGPVEGLEFLAEMDVITDDVYRGALVIVTDTANTPRISDARFSLGDQLIKIDHHPNDEPYGDLVWVNTNASSCSEIIVDFWQQHLAELTMTDNAARLLYAGIVGDTGRFLYPSTSAHTLAVAAQLRTFNFNAADLNRELDQMPLKVAKLAGYIYQNLEIDANGAARVVLPQSILNSYDIVDSETAAIVSMPGKIEDVLSWAIFVEQPEGYYRVRLRSKGPIINTIAKKHHGGGHPLASGANARDVAEIEVIYQEIQAACQEWAQK